MTQGMTDSDAKCALSVILNVLINMINITK